MSAGLRVTHLPQNSRKFWASYRGRESHRSSVGLKNAADLLQRLIRLTKVRTLRRPRVGYYPGTGHRFSSPELNADSQRFEDLKACCRRNFLKFKIEVKLIVAPAVLGVFKAISDHMGDSESVSLHVDVLQDIVLNGEVSCGNGIAPFPADDAHFTSPTPAGPLAVGDGLPYNGVPAANLLAGRPGSFSFSRSQAALLDGGDYLTPQRMDRFPAPPSFQPPLVSDSPYEKLKTLLKQSPLTTAPSPWASRGPPGLAGAAPPALTPGSLPRGTPGYRVGSSRLRPLGPSRLAANTRGPAFWQPTSVETDGTRRWVPLRPPRAVPADWVAGMHVCGVFVWP